MLSMGMLTYHNQLFTMFKVIKTDNKEIDPCRQTDRPTHCYRSPNFTSTIKCPLTSAH